MVVRTKTIAMMARMAMVGLDIIIIGMWAVVAVVVWLLVIDGRSF